MTEAEVSSSRSSSHRLCLSLHPKEPTSLKRRALRADALDPCAPSRRVRIP